MPNVLPPPRPAAFDKIPKSGREHKVNHGETWSTLAKDLRITPWNLIDFNFPGTYETFALNFQLATKHVNWYLREYVGCTAVNGPNYAFSSKIKGGKGVFSNGRIYLPPKTLPPRPVPVCVTIDIPPISLPWPVMAVLTEAGVHLPTRARCLWEESEINVAKRVFGDSLFYHQIYISDGSGGDDRPCTVAIPFDGVWIVILNVGERAYRNPGSAKGTLIHELVHAWQSQHHPQPWQYMVNCLKSQAAAKAASIASQPVVNSFIETLSTVRFPSLGDADAYAYIPGDDFGSFAGEQIAQHVEDDYTNYAQVPDKYKPSVASRAKIAKIASYLKSVPAGKIDPLNVRSLSTVRFAYEEQPNVVWHKE